MMASRSRLDELSPHRRRRNWKPLLLAIVVLAVAGVAGYWYLNPQLAPAWLRQYMPAAPVRLYKWRDSRGEIHYSNAPPPAGIHYSTVNYWRNANIIPVQPPASQ